MTCQFCDHKWTEPITKAGKNVLCPECRQRIRVPGTERRHSPGLAASQDQATHFGETERREPNDVQDAADVKYVKAESLQKADATGIEYEPRPLKQQIMFVLIPIMLIGGLGYGGCYLVRRSSDRNENSSMASALAQSDEASRNCPRPNRGCMPRCSMVQPPNTGCNRRTARS